MGFKGAKPFCESLSTFFSEESRGPSRPERQVKRDLRGKSEAGKGERSREKMRAHTKRTAGKQAREIRAKAAGGRAGRRNEIHRTRAHLREASRTAAGRRRSPGTKAAGGAQAGNKAAETAVLPCTPGAAGQTAASNFPHTLRLQKNSRGSRMDEKAGLKGYNSGRPRKERPARHMARHTGRRKDPLRTGKTRVRSFACPEGPCKTGPPKIRFAVFGWHGLFASRF